MVMGIYIFDCRKCGYVFHAKDSWGEFRSSFLTRFIRVWRTLKAGNEYFLGSLADAVGVSLERLERLIKRVERKSLNGKPLLLERHYGIRQVTDERTGEIKLVYRPHPVVLKDMDPESGEPWPYDIFSLEIAEHRHDDPIINRSLQLKVQVDYCFTSPTEVFIGLEHEGCWVACTQQSVVGEGVKEFAFEIPMLRKYGEAVFRLKAFHKEQDWVEDSSIEVKFDFTRVKCDACGRLLSLGGDSPEVKCPCGKAWYRVENGTVYTLKRDEAFCYDFNRNWAWYWRLRCPNCNSEVSLDFSSGRWFCNNCGQYVEPKHDYRLFRCILPCNHEYVYSIHYLINNIPLKCPACNTEIRLPIHIQTAWKNLNYTVFDTLPDAIVRAEYFARKNPWVVPAAIGGVLVLGAFLASMIHGRRERDGS
jgi:Zn finger protein HypA/HybF involved in hydrogenase expression